MLGSAHVSTHFVGPTAASPARLPRRLGLWSSILLVVGITIGSGIFRSPAGIARLVPDPAWMIGLWIAGGIITMCGALSVAELAASLPETGGLYAFLREGFGRPAAFLFGWSELVLIRASALGGIAVAFGDYFLRFIGVDPIAHYVVARSLAAAAIGLATCTNILGVRLGAGVVNVTTAAKFAALAMLVLAAMIFGGSHGGTVAHLASGPTGPFGIGSLGLALVSVLWAYDGFADLSFAGGEVKDPQRTLPRAIIFGTIAIIAIYVSVNLAYLYVNPIERVAGSPLVAADTMMAMFGRAGVVIVSLCVALSTFSSLNGTMLASPRVFFAMAEDGMLFGPIGRVHPRYQTPYVAILLAAVLGMILVLSRSFEALTETFVVAIWPFYALSVAALYRLRRTRPDLPRPYRVVGYPIVPAVFIASVVWFVLNALVSDPRPTLITFALILAGLPVYYAFFSHRGARNR